MRCPPEMLFILSGDDGMHMRVISNALIAFGTITMRRRNASATQPALLLKA
jgi:hypothetical protein